MLKNKNYVFGEDNVLVPSHLHYGKYMVEKFLQYKDSTAIIDPEGKTLKYSELAQLTVDIALSLARLGVRQGQVVSVCSEERLEFIPTVLGIMCAGATYTSTDSSGKATILHRVQMIKPTVIFCSPQAYLTHKETLDSVGSIQHYILYGDEELAGATLFRHFLTEHAPVEEFLPVPVNGWVDNALILYSSGTTGLPKGVPLTHLNAFMDMMVNIDRSAYKGKTVLTATEFYTFGLSCLHAGATVVFLHNDDAKTVLEAVQKYKVKILQQLPTTFRELAKTPILDEYDVSSVERIVSASSSLDPEVVKTIKMRFPNLRHAYQFYASSEAGVICSDEKAPLGAKPGSVGCACPGITIKVVDLNTREPVGQNQRGEICIKSPSLFPGYLGTTEFAPLDEEGFFKTGDIGYYDEDRYFYIVDRIKDMIKYRDFTVAPAELESILVSHPAVREAGVVGAPHETCIEVPLAFVALHSGADVTAEELTTFVNDQVAHWMLLAGGVRFVDKLPRGHRGKLDRKALRAML